MQLLHILKNIGRSEIPTIEPTYEPNNAKPTFVHY